MMRSLPRKALIQRPDRKPKAGKARTSRVRNRDALVSADLPASDRSIGPVEDSALKKGFQRLQQGLRRRTVHHAKPEYQRPDDNAAGYLLRQAYRVTRVMLRQGKLNALREAVPMDWRPKGKLAEIPFAWFLSLHFGRQGDITKATRNRIRLHAIALHHAHQHDVPPKYLVGFIYQVGGQKAIEKIFVAAGKDPDRIVPKHTR